MVKIYNIKIKKKLIALTQPEKDVGISISTTDAEVDRADKAKKMQTEQITQVHKLRTGYRRHKQDIDIANTNVNRAADNPT